MLMWVCGEIKLVLWETAKRAYPYDNRNAQLIQSKRAHGKIGRRFSMRLSFHNAEFGLISRGRLNIITEVYKKA